MNNCLLQDIEHEAAKLEAIRRAAEKLPELRDVTNVFACVATRTITASTRFDPVLIREHEAVLADAGWKFTREYDRTESGKLAREFKQDGVDVTVYYHPDVPGSTCKVNLVGYEQTPIYERVCQSADPVAVDSNIPY